MPDDGSVRIRRSPMSKKCQIDWCEAMTEVEFCLKHEKELQAERERVAKQAMMNVKPSKKALAHWNFTTTPGEDPEWKEPGPTTIPEEGMTTIPWGGFKDVDDYDVLSQKCFKCGTQLYGNETLTHICADCKAHEKAMAHCVGCGTLLDDKQRFVGKCIACCEVKKVQKSTWLKNFWRDK